MKIKNLFTTMILIAMMAVVSREAHDEWFARRSVEAKSRAMFSGDPIAWKSQAGEASELVLNKSS